MEINIVKELAETTDIHTGNTLETALRLAKRKIKAGYIDEAELIYQEILLKFPKCIEAKEGLRKLSLPLTSDSMSQHEPPEDRVDEIKSLYLQAQPRKAFERCEALISKYPRSATLFNLKGALLKSLGYLDLAIEAYQLCLSIRPNYAEPYFNIGIALQKQGKPIEAIVMYTKALSIKPNYAEAYNNMGNAYQEQGKLNEAEVAYKKALSIRPDFAEAYNNMGMTLQKQKKLEQAIEAYTKALSIKPDSAEACNNIANVHKEQGSLSEAIAAYTKALSIRPTYVKAIQNTSDLCVQLSNNVAFNRQIAHLLENIDFFHSPKLHILQAIKAFMVADEDLVREHLNSYERIDQQIVGELKENDQVFCSAYYLYLKQLLTSLSVLETKSQLGDVVYHLGDSHCLSYANHEISIDGIEHKVAPLITFGGKAFHFAKENPNNFKAITKANFDALSNHSKILISFGEIDCRPNEGFITTARKTYKSTSSLINDTVESYLNWFAAQNAQKNHNLQFFNIAAPVYNNSLTDKLNYEVAETVALFNDAMAKYSHVCRFNLIDVYNFTVGNNGFSNEIYHIDGCHLGPSAIPKIASQLI